VVVDISEKKTQSRGIFGILFKVGVVCTFGIVLFFYFYPGGEELKSEVLERIESELPALSQLGLPDLFQSETQESQETVHVHGPEDMVPLMNTLAEKYMEQNKEIKIEVSESGSDSGISSVLEGSADLSMSNRSPDKEESQLAEEKGITLDRTALSLDAIAFIVHPANPVDSLTLKQVSEIYQGRYSSWKQLGGKNWPISILGRRLNTGTHKIFQSWVLNNQEISQKMSQLPTLASVLRAASQTHGAIGYGSLGSIKNSGQDVKILKVKAPSGSHMVLPDEDSILAGDYPASQKLYFYYSDKKKNQISEFLKYSQSAEGKKAIKESGFVPVK
jgi:phosphate transport system substrate-binding protein